MYESNSMAMDWIIVLTFLWIPIAKRSTPLGLIQIEKEDLWLIQFQPLFFFNVFAGKV
jgi:hypothetical protein